jgi:gamma-glutamyltranspeptidase/glutathione hydrolase
VADADGNIVAYTFTIEQIGGNGIVVPGRGFLLNNELTDFNTESTSAANRAEGGKRPRSSIAPIVIERDGRPMLTVGSPGGATIITTVLQVLLNRLEFHDPLPQAIAAPRASQRNGARTEAEAALQASPAGRQLVSEFGQTFSTPAGNGELGAATGIEYTRGGRLIAAAEPTRRGGGSAAVVK